MRSLLTWLEPLRLTRRRCVDRGQIRHFQAIANSNNSFAIYIRIRQTQTLLLVFPEFLLYCRLLMAEINGRGSFNSMIINAAQFNNTRMYIKSWNENIALSCLLKSNLVKHLIQYGVAYLICKSTLRNIWMGYHFCQAISQFFDKRPVNRSGVNIVQQYGDKLIKCVLIRMAPLDAQSPAKDAWKRKEPGEKMHCRNRWASGWRLWVRDWWALS